MRSIDLEAIVLFAALVGIRVFGLWLVGRVISCFRRIGSSSTIRLHVLYYLLLAVGNAY